MQILAERLTIHPLLKPVPRLALDAPEMLALIASVEVHGVLAPLLINESDEIIDGRARLIAAHKAGLTEVPCAVRADEDAASLILDTLCARRHLTKSALAYLAFPLMEDAGTARHAARIRGLMAGKKARASIQSTHGGTVEHTAQTLGFGRDYYYRARDVVHLFARQPAYKAQMEPSLFSGEVSLQGVLAGWNGLQNQGKPRRQADQIDLFGDVFTKLRYHFKRTWGSMDDGKRAALTPQVRETVAEMPPEVRAVFVAEIKAAEQAAKAFIQKV